MEKRTLYAVVVMAIFGIIAFSALRAPEKGQRMGPPPRPVPALKSGDVARLEITTQKDEHTTLERKDGAWRVVAPSDWPADAQAVKALTDALEKMRFSDVVTENPAKHESLGVADKGSVHIKLTAGPTTTELLLGQTVGGFVMGRLAGKNEVWQVSNLAPYLANKPPKDWRDHLVMPLTPAEVDKLAVEVPGGSKIVLEKVAAADKAQPTWKVVESTGDAPKAGDALDPSQPSTVAQALSTLRAADFADGKDEKEAGLAPPTLLVTATQKGKAQTLELGAQNNEDVFVRVTGSPTIFVVKKYLLDRVQYRPIDYRDKTLLRYKLDEIAKLRVVQGKDETLLVNKDGKWVLGAGGAEADEQKAKALLGGVDNLVAQAFLTDKTVKTELDKPRALVSVETKAGKKATLKVGGLTKDQGDYYVAVEGGKDVFLAKKFAIDRLLRKPADLTATKTPAAKK